MGAEVKARITVDADSALKRIEDINKSSGYASASMSKMAKEIGEANAALAGLGAGMGGTASGTAYKNITEQLEKQALAYSLVDEKTKAAAQSASLYRSAIINLTKSGSLTKEQTDDLVRTYNNYKTAAASATAETEAFKSAQVGLGKESANSATKLLSVAKNILKFQLVMGPITAAVRGFKTTVSDSLKVAAEAEQVFNKLKTVFVGIEESASSAAKSLAASLGVANSTASSALSTVGDLLQAQGMGTAESLTTASGWVSTFQDIIAFKDLNMSLEEFAQTFMSGAAGNLRNFRTFGSIVKESAVNARLAKEGYDELTGSELELAKMTARANIALEQQKNAVNATEREWENMLSINRRLDEQTKAWKENVGNMLNTVVKPMKSWLADILTLSNKIASATEEIRTGEFTIKTTAVSDSDAKSMFSALYGKNVKSQMNLFEMMQYAGALDYHGASNLGSIISLITELTTGRNENKENVLKGVQDRIGITASDIADIIKATGITSSQIKTIAEEGNYPISDELLSLADSLVATWKEEQAAVTAVITSLEKLGSETDSFTESLASLAHMDFTSSNAEGLFSTWDIDVENMGDYSNRANELTQTAIGRAVRLATEQISGFSTDTFMDNIEKAFDTGDKAKAYQSWLDEIKDLYTILYNRQKKFGDVSDNTLNSVISLWGRVYDEMDAYQRGLEAQASFDTALSSLQSSTLSYQRQLQLVGADEMDAQIQELAWAFEEMKEQYADLSQNQLKELGIDLGKLDDEFDRQVKAYTDLYNAQEKYAAKLAAQANVSRIVTGAQASIEDRELLARYTGATLKAGGRLFPNANEAQAREFIEYDKKIKDLNESLAQMEYRFKLTGEKVYDIGDGVYRTTEEIDAIMQEDLANSLEDLADAAEVASSAWKDIGNRALASTGTFGSVVQQFTDGEGDVWSDIVNALLTIMENTDGWSEIADLLDQMFAMFEPVTDALIDLILSLPWEDIIFMLKVVASAITTIMAVVQGFQTIINWFWTNLKTVLHNIIEAILHPFTGGDQRSLKSWDSLMKELNNQKDAYLDRLDRIWAVNDKIERNTRAGDDYAKQLALLKDLYKGGALNLSEYSGAVSKVTGSPLGRIETYSGASYARGSGGVTYFSGDIVINGYNGDARELALEIERILNKRAMAGGGTFA